MSRHLGAVRLVALRRLAQARLWGTRHPVFCVMGATGVLGRTRGDGRRSSLIRVFSAAVALARVVHSCAVLDERGSR